MKNLAIAHKLWLGVAFLILAISLIIGFAGWRTSAMTARIDEVFQKIDAKLIVTHQWVTQAEVDANRALLLAQQPDGPHAAAWQASRQQAQTQLQQLRQQLESLELNEADRAQLTRIDTAAKQFEQALQQPAQAMSALETYSQALNELYALQPKASVDARRDNAVERSKTVILAGGMAGSTLLITVFAAAVLIRSIRDPLQRAVAAAARMASGDLRGEIPRGNRDEIGQLLSSLSTLRTALNQLLGEVHHTSTSVHSASSEIALGNQDLSNRTEQTAGNLQETASSMVDLTSNVHESANAAQQSHMLVTQASETARRGGEVMSKVIQNMDGIASASNKISDIIGVIDGIAFQTNILALNAAVEAARAGEQGRGFAVVASEVRTLAQRSADAAREIKGLINASVEQVEAGSKLVHDAGRTMEEIVNDVTRVSAVISDISTAAAHQSAGISQINQAINQLDQMTQQNAALVEESSAAANSLTQQAEMLANAIRVFKTDAVRA